jgi:putative membrane protein
MPDIMNYGSGGWMMSGMWLISSLFWIAIIAGVVLLVKWLTDRNDQGRTSTTASESPLDILKKRYAKGEIDKDAFEQMKRDLS